MKNEIKRMGSELGIPQETIDALFEEQPTLSNEWKALTFKELRNIDESELPKLLSYCWKEGRYRCSCIGISELTIDKTNTVSYSDRNGDPMIDLWTDIDDDFKIDNVGDGTWNYGLYRKINH